MAPQITEQIGIGEIRVSANKGMSYKIPSLTSALAVVVYDFINQVGGMAHIALPDSSLSMLQNEDKQQAGLYADLAIPSLLAQYAENKGQPGNIIVKLVGGSQLFNFGGGGGNALNTGSRLSTAIKTALAKEGLTVEKMDIGGNKARSIRFDIATGELFITQAGQPEYTL